MIKIQDGDIYKILPILDKGKKIPCITTHCIWLPQSQIILYDIDGKILPKIYRKNPKLYSKKHFFCVIHKDQVDFISVGKTLHQKIILTPEAISLENNHHLKINIEYVNVGASKFPSFAKCEFIQHDWTPPFNLHDTNNQSDWLTQSQSPIWKHLEQFNVIHHIDKIKKEINVDLSEIIAEFRDKKINQVLGIYDTPETDLDCIFEI